MFLESAALALLIEQFSGYPKSLYRRFGHPVEWLGRLIGWVDVTVNREGTSKAEGRLRGVAGFLIVIAATLAVAVSLAQVA